MDFGWDRNARIVSHQVAGRNMESLHFVGGSKTMDLVMDFVPEIESREDLLYKVSWLESLTYNEGFKSPPPRIRLLFGGVIEEQLWVVQKVTPKLSLFNRQHDLRPSLGYVAIHLIRWAEYNIKRSDVLLPVPTSLLPEVGYIRATAETLAQSGSYNRATVSAVGQNTKIAEDLQIALRRNARRNLIANVATQGLQAAALLRKTGLVGGVNAIINIARSVGRIIITK